MAVHLDFKLCNDRQTWCKFDQLLVLFLWSVLCKYVGLIVMVDVVLP
jgi:hypothetical protein